MKKKNAQSIADVATRARTYLMIAMCMLLFVAGLFFAGRQHFSSMDFGMKNSTLRKQIEELESEKRRLLLAREVSMSPAEVKKAAKRAGLFGEETSEKIVAQVTSTTKDIGLPPSGAPSNPLITKTVAVQPAPRVVAATFQKSVKPAASEKKPGAEKKTQAAE